MKIDHVRIIRTPQENNQITITAVAEVSYYTGSNTDRRTETFKSKGSPLLLKDGTMFIETATKSELAELRQHLNVFGLMIDGPLEVTP